MNTSIQPQSVQPPPRWILGVAMAYWGVMTGRPLLGVMLGLFVEAPHWLRLRWDFDSQACTRAWYFTCIAGGIAAALIWLEGNRNNALSLLLTWLPPLLMPLYFVQSFGLQKAMPLNAFSFLARQRRKQNQRLGLPEAVYFIHFGNILFVAILISATMGGRASSLPWVFLAGMMILTGWMIAAKIKSSLIPVSLALAIAAAIALAGQISLKQAHEWASSYGITEANKFDPNNADTLIGRPGKVIQSPEIIWRLIPEIGAPMPRLLRLASYIHYKNGTWDTARVSALDFNDLATLELTRGDAYFILNDEAGTEAIRPELPRFRIRGAAASETPLPLPGNATSLRDIVLDGIEKNTFGSVRIFPKDSVFEGTVLWNGGTNPEYPPFADQDFFIPPREQPIIASTARDIGLLDETNFDKKLNLLRHWFFLNFSYTRDLKIHSTSAVVSQPTGITKFLTTQREGHCEYFATATALLLREAGIAARYTTGYVVHELDLKRNERIIRGTHGHSWCRVWNSSTQKWVDFDTTPPQWLPDAIPALTMMQRLDDSLKRIREDFFLWRNRPTNRLWVTSIMSLITLAVIGFISLRLWKSKRHLEGLKAFPIANGPVIRTPLHDIEPHARKHLGYRPMGQTFSAWLAMLRPYLADEKLLYDAILIHQRLRFDPAAESSEDRERLAELTRKLEKSLRN